MNEQREKAELIAKTLFDKKAIDVAIIDISPKASFADYFVIASGGSEGRKSSGWILMDYGDVVVNIMSVEMRERYNLEKVWGDCEITEIES